MKETDKITDPRNLGPVTMGRLMQLAWGFAPVYVIQAGIETGIFNLLKNRSLSRQALIEASGCSERGVDALLNTLLVLRLLELSDEGNFCLAPEAAKFLVDASPEVSLVSFFTQLTKQAIPNWTQLSECVRTGRPAVAVNRESVGAPFFSAFADSLFPLSFPAAQALARQLQVPPTTDTYRVLDIGAGGAVWSIPLAQHIPSARVTALDWPQVIDEITSRFVQSYGLAARYEMLSGDVLEVNYGHGYDLAIVGLLFHTEGEARSKAIIKKIYDAIAPGGKIVIVEFLVDRDRRGSLDGLLFGLNMLVHSDSGTTWSYEELSSWLEEAGFHNIEVIKLPRPSPTILAQKPFGQTSTQ
jgi:2-polyprenyl-3-methyl-5-hydroxy-6-metoxy-1,4-benzoquinol methylase